MTQHLDVDTRTDGQYLLGRDYLRGFWTRRDVQRGRMGSIALATTLTATGTAYVAAACDAALVCITGHNPGGITVIGNATGFVVHGHGQGQRSMLPGQPPADWRWSVPMDLPMVDIVHDQDLLWCERPGFPDETARGLIYEVQAGTSFPAFSPPTNSVLQELLRLGEDEVFEDGRLTPFSRGVATFIELFGPNAIQVIRDAWENGRLKPDSLAETLRVAGRLDDPETHDQRLLLLAEALHHLSPRVRDAATLGMASLEDMRAVPYLERAATAESLPELRALLLQAVAGLTAR